MINLKLSQKYFKLILILIAFFLIYFAQLLYTVDNHFLIDDSFIYLRYARNISHGYGFVWNPGEQPSEGFTSILYLLILVASEKIGLPTIIIMPTLTMICSLLILMMSWLLGELLISNHEMEKSLAVILIGLSPIFMFWNVSGMDISFFSALLILSVILYINYLHKKYPAWLVGCVFALTSLARPEGVYLFGTTLLFDSLINHKKLMQKHALAMILSFISIYVPVFTWKWIYFGYPFPNTYYAKTGDLSTIKYQLEGGAFYLGVSLVPVIASLGVPSILLLTEARRLRWKKIITKEIAYIVVLIIFSWGGIVVSGGDHFVNSRFLMPTIPLITLLIIVIGVSSYTENKIKSNNIFPKIIALTVTLISLLNYQPWMYIFPDSKNTSLSRPNGNHLEYYQHAYSGFINMGKILQVNLPENSSVAVVPIGAIGYYSNLEIIDMVGIVDVVLAHEPLDPKYASTWRPGHDKGDGSYILSRQPDYIQLIDRLTSLPTPGLDNHAMQYKSIVEIWESPEFHTNYEFFPIKTKEGWYYNLYRRINRK